MVMRQIPILLGGGFYTTPVYQEQIKKHPQPKVPALLRKDTPVYSKTSK
jgi:hypothetical protein